MKLPIGYPIWNPLKHEYYGFLSIHVYSNLPKIGRQCTPPEWKSWIQVKVTFWFWLMNPPPRNVIVGYRSKWHFGSGWCTPPRNEKVGYRSKWHFGSGWCTPLPPNWNWTKHECYRKKIISREVIKYILPIYPPFHYHYLTLCLNRKLVNFNFKWVYGLEPRPPALSSQKIKMLILDYIQLLVIGWAGRWTRTPSTTLLQPKK